MLLKGLGLGIDIVDVARVGRLVRNRRFLERVFTNREIFYCRTRAHPAQHFAVRFAAKEAVWKALNDLQDFHRHAKGAGHRNIEVVNSSSGKPGIVLSGSLGVWRGKVKVSLSHADQQAVAVALVHL